MTSDVSEGGNAEGSGGGLGRAALITVLVAAWAVSTTSESTRRESTRNESGGS